MSITEEEREIYLSICIYKKIWKLFDCFFGEGEIKGVEKGIALAKYCILQHQSFPTQ